MKESLLLVLVPLARLLNRIGAPLSRLWSHACLAARIDSPLHNSVVVLGPPEVHGSARVRMGRNLYLYPDLYFETQESGTIVIGDGVVMSRGVHVVAFSSISIGDGTMIGEYSSVRDANHRHGSEASIRDSGHSAKPISIGRNVWIGRGVAVLAGVSIGDGAVIGANAVVTRDVPPGAVVAGIPARPLIRSQAA